jgi:hypothetical protein
MSARPARRLRVAAAAGASAPAAAEAPVQLVSAFSAAGRVARAEGLAAAGVIGHELRLPGIGGRYLAGIAAHAHARGWDGLEVVALLDAVEERSAMWVVTPSAGSLRRAGLIAAGRGPRRASPSMRRRSPPWPLPEAVGPSALRRCRAPALPIPW